MAYCGAIGSVNVLEFMSTDLFDEAQENPFLLQVPSPTKQTMYAGTSDCRLSPRRDSSNVTAKALELPLHDPQNGHMSPTLLTTLWHTQQHQQSHSPSRVHGASSPQRYTSSPTGRNASVTFDLPKSILKRASSYAASDVSTAATSDAYDNDTNVAVSETELHKLLYSLARFSVASSSTPTPEPLNAPPSPPSPARHLHVRASTADPSSRVSPTRASTRVAEQQQQQQQCHSTGRAALKSRQAAAATRSIDRSGYLTDPDSDAYDDDIDDDDGYASSSSAAGRSRIASPRGSVTFETVKSLLRGGGGVQTSRLVQRSIPGLRRKSLGTISSKLKSRDKFTRPTIWTDANQRVSTMKLGTKPLPAKVKHVPLFVDPLDDVDAGAGDSASDGSGLPLSPRTRLRATSLVQLETLDKIGTRAACPVHLLDEPEATPDYSLVQARVDSHNRIARPSPKLRRPSAWLVQE